MSLGFPRQEYWSGSPFPPPGTPVLVSGQVSAWQLVRRGKALVLSLFPLCHCSSTWIQMWTPGWVVLGAWQGGGRCTDRCTDTAVDCHFLLQVSSLFLPGTEPASPALAKRILCHWATWEAPPTLPEGLSPKKKTALCHILNNIQETYGDLHLLQ